jgi:hypothetical protein
MATIYCAKLNCSWNRPTLGECGRDSIFVNVLGQCRSFTQYAEESDESRRESQSPDE